MVLTITYETSSDFKASDRPTDYGNIARMSASAALGVNGQVGQIVALFDVPPLSRATSSISGETNTITVYDDAVSSASFTPATDQKPQTFSANMFVPAATHDSHRTFCLAFPPAAAA